MATQDPLGSPQSFKVVLKEMEAVPKVVEVRADASLDDSAKLDPNATPPGRLAAL